MKFKTIRTLFFCFAILITVTLFAQQQDLIGLTDFPVPAWPQDGIVPASLKENYVFVDLPKNEYVIAYPENLGTDSYAKDGPGKIKLSRYSLLRNVVPSVAVAVTPVNTSKFKYTYSVANAASAKQSIDVFVMSVGDKSSNDLVQTPDGWFGILQKNRALKTRNPEWTPHGGAIVWTFQKPDAVIPPGSEKKGFEIESELRPGFSVALLRKAESVDVKVATHGNVPKEVKDQLDSLLMVEYNSKTVLTFGPKFDKTADDHTIADDYIQGLLTLSRSGVLDLNSDFARNLLSELTAIKPGASAAGMKLGVPPKTAAETELLNALKVSLKLK